MRVLFTTTPGRGHYHAMLPLADALRDAGHEVLWATAPDARERLRGLGHEAAEAGLPEDATSDGLFARYPELQSLPPAERPDFLFSNIFGPPRAAPMLEQLLPIAEAWKPSLLVCDQSELAGPIVAARLGVPNVTHGFGHPLPEIRLSRAGEAMADIWRAQGLEPDPYAGAYVHLYLDIYPDALKAFPSPHIREAWKVRPNAPAGEPAAGEAEPLVYVTFGTVFNQDRGLIATVVEGIRDLPVKVVVTVGPGNDPAALGDQPANVEVAEFIPQAQLLPRSAAVVSHAGSGTFLAALAHGLPQLLLPQGADQFLNAAAAAKAGAARVIEPGDVSAGLVREELQRVLSDDGLRAAARRLAGEIGSMPGAPEVAGALARRYGAD